MDDATIKALIGGAAAIIGGLIGVFVAAINAKQKLKELEVIHAQALRETYLANARQYTETIYVPISLAITSLSNAYYNFRRNLSPDDELTNTELAAFKSVMIEFIDTVDNLLARGASAFLTNDLDTQLLSFKNFVQESLSAEKPISKVVISYSARLLGNNLRSSRAFTVSGKEAEFWLGSFGFSQMGFGVRFSNEEILAAPPASTLFEERFMRDTNLINYLVKEVTLGAHHPSS